MRLKLVLGVLETEVDVLGRAVTFYDPDVSRAQGDHKRTLDAREFLAANLRGSDANTSGVGLKKQGVTLLAARRGVNGLPDISKGKFLFEIDASGINLAPGERGSTATPRNLSTGAAVLGKPFTAESRGSRRRSTSRLSATERGWSPWCFSLRHLALTDRQMGSSTKRTVGRESGASKAP